jgi:glycosyltransferase involved in cell wall biosynthesis
VVAAADVNEPLISIALCTYNGAAYLRQQLDSLLAQTYRNTEIVAVDDCSTDDTLAILEEYGGRDGRIRVFANSSNLGFRKNFPLAMSRCGGELIAPCDQDDVWLPEKLSSLAGAIGDHTLAYCDSELIDQQGRPMGLAMSDYRAMLSTDNPALFTIANCVSGHAMLFRRSLLDRALPVPDCYFYDWWLATVAAGCGGIVFHDRKLVRYRQHRRSITRSFGGPKVDRDPQRVGDRLSRLLDIRRRIEEIAKLPGPSQPLMRRLCALWIAREDAWISPALAAFMFRHGPALHAIVRARRSRLRYFTKFLPGVRLKRLIDPRGFARVVAPQG